MYKCSLEVHLEDSLVGLENHARLHQKVFVQVHPGAVRAWLAAEAVSEHPRLLLLEELDGSLVLREKTVADSDVALRRPPDNYGLAFVLVVVNLARRWPAEDLELEFALAVVIVDVDTRLQMDALLLRLLSGLHILLDVRVHAKQRASYNVNNNVRLSHVN